MTLQERINNGEFENKLIYLVNSSNEERKKWGEEQEYCISKFKKALLKEYNMTNHPKAEMAYDMAWEYGHSGGFSEVLNIFSDLIKLLE